MIWFPLLFPLSCVFPKEAQMSIYNLRFELRKDRPNRLGKCQIRIRIPFKGKSKYISTELNIHPDHWSDEAQCIKHTAPNATQLNHKLAQLKLDYEKEILDLERITGNLDETKLNKVLAKEDIFDFHKYAEDYFKTFKNKFKEETLETYSYDLEKLKEFRPKLSIHEWTPELVAQYHTFLIEVRGNSTNTCNKALKPIKKVLRYAREVQHIIKSDPFKVYNIGKEKTLPEYLETNEIESLWNICVNDSMEIYPTLKFTGLYFLLSCYTGLRYSDLSQIHNKNIIKNDRVFLVMVKGQDPLSLPLLTRAKKLVKLIGDKKIISNQKGNEYLKILQDLAGIKKSLHWHMGRHTMAMLLSDLGFDKEVTAILLGHRSIKSTAIYHKISKSRASKEIEDLQKKLDEIGHN